jgi:hypothetical protein
MYSQYFTTFYYNRHFFKDAAVPVFELIFETSTTSKKNKQINEALEANKVSP